MWRRVVFASDCRECDACGEPVCPVCIGHYADCDCPGPMQDDEYEYSTDLKGYMIARLRNEIDD
jgi:hypothetical protein